MPAVKLSEGVYSVGIMNPNMRVFDIVMQTESGTSYNSYIVKGADKTALIETSHDSFMEIYLDNIREVCDPAEIDYVVLNHNEPDHSGALARLLAYMPNAKVVASVAGATYLKNITNMPLDITKVKDGDSLDLGGKTLRFVNAPFLHWPDSMFTYLPEDKMVFTCDFLGCHYCEPYTWDRYIAYPDAYETALKLYYNAIFGPFGPYVQKGLDKLETLEFDTVCNSHGPILTKDGLLPHVMEMYRQWSAPSERTNPQIPVFYCSAYGNTKHIAEAIREGILSVHPQAETECYDLIAHDMADLQAKLNQSNGFAVGTPTLNRDALPPVWMLLAGVDAINCAKKPCAVFGSYGWSGEGIPNVKQRLESLKMKVVGEFKTIFVPTAEDLEKAKELGAELARAISL